MEDQKKKIHLRAIVIQLTLSSIFAVDNVVQLKKKQP